MPPRPAQGYKRGGQRSGGAQQESSSARVGLKKKRALGSLFLVTPVPVRRRHCLKISNGQMVETV